ncbi:MAG TPA: hypothetical protein VG983_11005 [Caulobacterales bacterium]|jgi:antitoxin (DNA-binding transcriptional repressor) of toxin-antitoxin stability system|nr:hypothetical protein [Caulobacterales bacterium]
MKHVDAKKAGADFIALLDEVQKGEKIAITRDGETVAVLAAELKPAGALTAEQIARRQAAFRRLEELSKRIDPGAFDWKEAVSEGRT